LFKKGTATTIANQSTMSKQKTTSIQTALLAWYKKHQRDLPWRRTDDPYAIWISEIMLQQTQVATAIPYYERFLKKFPTVQALANAPIDDVLKHWEGLGYYSRAQNLHKAAKQVVDEFDGNLPSTVEDLLKLSGIGPYTAGAIASIAFGLDEPVLDGNVIRVLSRLYRIHENPKETPTQKKLWSLARELVPSGEASFFNQALMDLGATVCIPKQPRCLVCPLHDECEARNHNEQNDLPIKVKKQATPHYDVGVGIVWKNGKFLLVQRPQDKLLGGLWEFPGGKCQEKEPFEKCVIRNLEEKLGIRVDVNAQVATVKHAFTHFRITVHAFECELIKGKPQSKEVADWAWITLDDVDDYALPKAAHKIVAELRKQV
jgi:A/G-specific adenine glycosylase